MNRHSTPEHRSDISLPAVGRGDAYFRMKMQSVEISQHAGFDDAAAQPTANLPATAQAALAPVADLAAAEAVTAHLAHTHYENFSVVSMLLPKYLRQDFCNVYAFCRVADDLGDEVGDRAQAAEYLVRFREQLHACYEGKADTAVFVALRGTIARHDIPIQPFLDLIDAFEQD